MVDAASLESQKRQNSFLVTLSAIMALLVKQASRLTAKPKSSAATKSIKDDDWKIDLRTPKRPKKLLSNISSKALLPFGQNRKKKDGGEEVEGGWGNGGVWQKEILMGGKCEPLDFSGAIYYDIKGKQMSDVPLRSPRASPLPGYLSRTPQRTL